MALIINLPENLSETENALIKELNILYPLYIQNYEEALFAVLRNIEDNNSNQRRGSGVLGGAGEELLPLRQSNIIAFTGDRGSGKTTAISEFCDLLRRYHEKADKWEKMKILGEMGGKRRRFRVLQPIDASVLGEDEDLIEVILASMYQVFDRESADEKKEAMRNKISEEFRQAYKDYVSVGRQDVLGDAAIVKLKNISNSMKTREAFDKLINSFLRYLGDEEEESYLVVTIDDLDMNPEKGFEMLELLHKYLENRRVIVLVAIKYEQIQMLSQKHFIDSLIPKYVSVHREVYLKYEKEAWKLGNDYLLKVLPLTNRIYLPEKKSLLLRGKVGYEPDKLLEIKKFILKKIADKMGIYYDAAGLKKHFCLPDTVRELVFYTAFLDSLLSMDEIEQCGRKEGKTRLYDWNYGRFNNDIERRMAYQVLNDKQKECYRLIEERKIERRVGYAVNFIDVWMKNKSNEEKQEKQEKQVLTDQVDEHDYCYADLLEKLYVLGRADYADKVLVHCLLASFTAEMTMEYYHYINDEDVDRSKKAANCLRSFLGRSFGGMWLNEAVPQVRVSSIRKAQVGYIKDRKKPAGQSLLYIDLFSKSEGKGSSAIGGIIEFVTDVIPYIECVTLLLSNFRDSTGGRIAPDWRFQLKVSETEDGLGKRLEISDDANYVDFDMFGFVGKEVKEIGGKDEDGFSCYGENLHSQIVEALQKSFSDYLNSLISEEKLSESDRTEYIDQLEGEAEKKSIWHEKMKERIFFPYYNLDMSYNIMKRVRRRMLRDMREEISDIYEYFRIVYGYMADCLLDEQDYYTSLYGDEQEKAPHLYQDFISSPFIRAFGIETDKASGENERSCKGTLDKARMNEIFQQLFTNLVDPTALEMLKAQNIIL